MRVKPSASTQCVACYCLLLGSLCVSGAAQAQVPLNTQDASVTAGRNIVRVDWFAPLGANIAHNFWTNKGLLMPVAGSYERAIAKRWSVGAEALLNGGYPDQRRKSVGLMARYYVRPNRKTLNPLAGLYVAPVVNYLALKVTDEPPLLVVRAQRLRTGVLLGWQHKVGKSTSHFMMDFSAGALYWSVIGTDRRYQPDKVSGTGFGILEAGVLPDARGGIGYQF